MSAKPTLSEIAAHIPLGFECRGCGGSAYNWVMKCARYAETGEGCESASNIGSDAILMLGSS